MKRNHRIVDRTIAKVVLALILVTGSAAILFPPLLARLRAREEEKALAEAERIAAEEAEALRQAQEAEAQRREAAVLARLAEADALLADGMAAEAVRFLEDAYAQTGEEGFSERGEWIREHALVVRMEERYPGNEDFAYRTDYEYDAQRRLTAERRYTLSQGEWDGEGGWLAGGEWTEGYRREEEYDDAGRNSATRIYGILRGELAEFQWDRMDYDPDGKLLRRSTSLAPGGDGGFEESMRWEYTYDEAGKLLAETRCYLTGGEFVERGHTEYRYDEEGKLAETLAYDQGLLVTRTTYDPWGNIRTEDQTYSGNHSEYTYEYDGAGRIFSEDFVLDNGRERTEIPGRVVNEYDGEGKLLRTYETDEDGVTVLSGEWTYDADGRVRTERLVDSASMELLEEGDDSVLYTENLYVYDVFGNLLTQESDGREIFVRRYFYELFP